MPLRLSLADHVTRSGTVWSTRPFENATPGATATGGTVSGVTMIVRVAWSVPPWLSSAV